MAPREVSFRAFSAAYDYLGTQYPHQSSQGRRDSDQQDHGNGPPSSSQPRSVASRSRDRSKVNSADTSIFMPSSPAAMARAVTEYQSEDFQSRRHARRAATPSDGTVHRTKSTSGPDDEDARVSPDFAALDDAQSAAAPDIAKRGIHIPERTSSNGKRREAAHDLMPPLPPLAKPVATQHAPTPSSSPPSPEYAEDQAYDPGARSSGASVFSQETSATSIHTLPPLQSKGPDNSDAQHLEPVLEDDPRSWDLVAPPMDDQQVGMYALEKRAEQLISAEHLRAIFDDPKLLLRFTGFLNAHRPRSIPILIYYLDALKALRAINYANAIAEALEPIKGHGFTDNITKPTQNAVLEEKANRAFDVLVQEDLPAYVAHTWIQVVSISIQRRITGTLAPHLREASEGLAEVFCLTDPSRTDDPIVFASEEFTRTTQYGMNYIIGRNCRLLQGPRTSPHAVRRIAIATTEGREHTEIFVNYRRDGSPFLNLLMIAPLMDSRGNIRYFIGAQVDVSGLLKDCSEMPGLIKLLEKEQNPVTEDDEENVDRKDEFQELGEMFNGAELDTVRKFGGRMHKEYVDDSDRESLHGRPRLLLKDPSQDLLHKETTSTAESATSTVKQRLNGKLEGVYQNYLLIRPAPSLRILFTSPSLRVPGILQSPFLNRVGGSTRVRADLGAALAEGRGVTAKIRWLTRPDDDGEGEGRPRWIHCTPLLGHSGAVGVWMVVLVDEEGATPGASSGRRFRQAPPVSNNIGGKEWDATKSRERKQLNTYDKENERRGGSISTNDYYHPGTSHSRGPSPMPGRSRERRPSGSRQVTSTNASEFSFNLRG